MSFLDDLDPMEILYCVATNQITNDDLMELHLESLLEIEAEMIDLTAIQKSGSKENVIWNTSWH